MGVIVDASKLDIDDTPEEDELGEKKPPKKHSPISSFTQACLCLFMLVFLLVGGVLIFLGIQGVQLNNSAKVCTCRITDFQASQVYVSQGEPVPTCADIPGFVVRATCSDAGGMDMITDWMPTFHESYWSETGSRPLDGPFKCCPASTSDICGFQDADTLRFCDDHGAIKDGCPSAQWGCYFMEGAERNEDLTYSASELHVGDPSKSWVNIAIGAPIALLGIALVVCIVRERHLTMQANGQSGPPSPVTSPRSAPIVQQPQQARAPPARKAVWELDENDEEEQQASPEQKQLSAQSVLAELQEGQNKEEVEARRTEGENLRIMHNMAHYYEKNKDSEERALYVPERHGPSPRHGLLYDTGDSSTFRRMACTRMASEPGEELMRMEVAINEPARGLDRIFRVSEPNAGSKLIIHKQPPIHFADLYGLRRGQYCTQVGDLTWPNCTGRELLEAFRASQRPVFMVFEARIEDLTPATDIKAEHSAMEERVRMRAPISPSSRMSSLSPASPSSIRSPWSPCSPSSTALELVGDLPGVVPERLFQTPRDDTPWRNADRTSELPVPTAPQVGIGGAGSRLPSRLGTPLS